MIWSSLLFSSPAWSTPKTTTLTRAALLPRPIAAHASIADTPSTSRQQGLPSTTGRSRRYRAASLLPLRSLQATSGVDSGALSSPPFSDSTTPTIAQENIPVLADSDNSAPPPAERDPELGVLRLQAPRSPSTTPTGDPPGQIRPGLKPCASGAQPDPELGCLPLQALPPPPPPRQPVVYLIARVDYFRSSNVFSATDPVNDGLVRPGLTLFTAPALGPNTYFVASVDSNLIRYNTQSQIDYNELRFRAGIFQRLSPTMFGEIGWSNQQLFIAGSKIPGLPVGTRFLNDHGIRFELSRRDQLSKRLSLNTFYQLRLSFADPDIRSRVLNSFIASFNYDYQTNLQLGLDYQFALANFTAIQRDDRYHQVAARLTYTAFRNTQMNVFVGYSFGGSSDPTVGFNGLILGVSLTVNLGLF
ncbi:hypothetical protein C7B82_18660 [Stenomitos frigidus ULC18]|uniref:Uncharacterized protein n=1 Tax=Stenomitos frigidus ULC18 TaxID=2107698 RepID=A0A2T1E297_9CYAN|nr:hypothetical protein C7B82_18660 [Stenomitos frigidus ULC18]